MVISCRHFYTRPALLLLLLLIGCTLAACSTTQIPPQAGPRPAVSATIHVDGQTHNLTTEATTVRELLAEASITVADIDNVTPPLFTPLTDNMTVNIVRITESVEILEETIPFERKIVRNEAMEADAEPLIIQGGQPGLQEVTVRIVYHDGLEVERQRTQVTMIEEAQDEIMMIGVGSTAGDLQFAGSIAYVSGGNAVLLRNSTAFPQQLDTGAGLDGRVFALSPSGSHLLYTRVLSNTGRFNNALFVISTQPGAQPRPLEVENVLWADWNPASPDLQQIAYTTAIGVDVPPGWEANNDLWVANVLQSETAPFEPELVVEAYPATYAWWGGNFEWSPDGQYIAYSYADEVGLIDLEATTPEEQRIQLRTFTEYNTRSDWVWVPTLTWSPDGQYLAFSAHSEGDPEAPLFDTWVANIGGMVAGRFVDQSGMWSHPHWSPALPTATATGTTSYIAFLRALNPVDSLNSNYTLWLMDQDGSNAHQIYPAVGENSRFPREQRFMAWGPTGRDIAFVFDNALYLFNLDLNQAFRVTQDDTVASRPTWAPYGAAVTGELPTTTVSPSRTNTPLQEEFLPEE